MLSLGPSPQTPGSIAAPSEERHVAGHMRDAFIGVGRPAIVIASAAFTQNGQMAPQSFSEGWLSQGSYTSTAQMAAYSSKRKVAHLKSDLTARLPFDLSYQAASPQTPSRTPVPTPQPESRSTRLLYLLDYHRPFNPDTDVAQFDGVIIQFNSPADRVSKLKALNPSIVALYYRAAHKTWIFEENWPIIREHETWFAHGENGRPVKRALDSSNTWYVMDFGNAEYRAYIINYIVNVVRTRGFDGVFIDGPPPTLKTTSTDPDPTQAFRAAWHTNTRGWLAELKAALGSKLLITNSTIKSPDTIQRSGFPFPDPEWEDDDFLPYVDGTMIEGAFHAPWEPPTHIQGSTQWNRQQAQFQRNVDAGKAVFVLSGVRGGTEADRKRWALFSYGSFLLRTDGKRSWFLWGYGPSADSHLFPELDLDLGAPAGDPYLANGLWNRDFARGKVLVNASYSAYTVDLPSRFRLPNGTQVTRVTLQPWTAMILLK